MRFEWYEDCGMEYYSNWIENIEVQECGLIVGIENLFII